MSEKIICYHHNDLDGECSAHVVRKAFPDSEVECIEVDYGIDYDLSKVTSEHTVYLVDFRFSPEEVTYLLETAKDFIWIDHHKTSIEEFSDFDREIKGLREVGRAGCVLTYEYLFPEFNYNYLFSKHSIPEYIRLLGDWDVWTFEFGERTKYFQYYMKGQNSSPDAFIWDALYKDFLEDDYNVMQRFIDFGEQIYVARLQYFEDLLGRFGYDVEFEGYKAKACNAGFVSSELFNTAGSGYDLFIAYAYDGDLYKVSLYSTSIDTSEIAKKHGGGGHAGASGFNCKELPF